MSTLCWFANSLFIFILNDFIFHRTENPRHLDKAFDREGLLILCYSHDDKPHPKLHLLRKTLFWCLRDLKEWEKWAKCYMWHPWHLLIGSACAEWRDESFERRVFLSEFRYIFFSGQTFYRPIGYSPHPRIGGTASLIFRWEQQLVKIVTCHNVRLRHESVIPVKIEEPSASFQNQKLNGRSLKLF